MGLNLCNDLKQDYILGKVYNVEYKLENGEVKTLSNTLDYADGEYFWFSSEECGLDVIKQDRILTMVCADRNVIENYYNDSDSFTEKDVTRRVKGILSRNSDYIGEFENFGVNILDENLSFDYEKFQKQCRDTYSALCRNRCEQGNINKVRFMNLIKTVVGSKNFDDFLLGGCK